MKHAIFLSALLTTSASAQHEHHGHHDHQAEEPVASEESELRDPHAYSGGYTSHSSPYHDPEMPPHLHGTDDLYWALKFDRLEFVSAKEEKPHTSWEINSWLGKSFNKLWLKSEGEYSDKKIKDSENELFWSHAIDPYWDSTLGVRYDAGDFEGKAYAALGIQGLAPYWFETSATLYIGDRGSLGFNAEVEYELLFTQRLILEPRLELDLKDLARKAEGEHPSHIAYGMRLRYEIYRRFAPYLGIEQSHSFRTKKLDLASHDTDGPSTEIMAGLRFWF